MMSRPGEMSELLRAAFPRDRGGAGDPVCAWDGRPRVRTHALCRLCWSLLPSTLRQEYRRIGSLTKRAEWILAHRPTSS
jgi:hypothetical protein